MVAAKLLTDAEIERRLAAARDGEKRARAKIAKLKRECVGAARRLDTQRKCCLGGALLAMAARGTDADARLVAFVRQYLTQHPPHESNRTALEGTVFALETEVPHAAG